MSFISFSCSRFYGLLPPPLCPVRIAAGRPKKALSSGGGEDRGEPPRFVPVRCISPRSGFTSFGAARYSMACSLLFSCFMSESRNSFFRCGDDPAAVVEGQRIGFGAFGQPVVLAFVGDVGTVASALDEHFRVFLEGPQRRMRSRGCGFVLLHEFHGAFVGDRIGIVVLGQRGERLAVADIGAVFADAYRELLAVEFAEAAGQGEERQRFVERDRLDELALLALVPSTRTCASLSVWVPMALLTIRWKGP